MKIHLTKQEYRELLDMLYLANWVISAVDESGHDQLSRYEQVEQKLLAYAKDFGFEHYVEHEKMNGRYYPTRMFEDESASQKIINQYNDNVFWDELASRMTERDMEAKYGKEKLARMEWEEVVEEMTAIEQAYQDEFSKTGLQKVYVSGLVK